MDHIIIPPRDPMARSACRQRISGRVRAALLLGLLLIAAAAAAERVGGFVLPNSAAASTPSCVEPTEYMRRNHFELIRHQRDETVYGGIRSTKHSLAGCVTCHVGHDQAGDPIPIADAGQFCNACHRYAAVRMNCFDCHATVPVGEGWNQTEAAAPGPAARLADTALPPDHSQPRQPAAGR